jgi:hypothetical protein
MNRTTLVRAITRTQRCPDCRHIKQVNTCACRNTRCICNPSNRQQ